MNAQCKPDEVVPPSNRPDRWTIQSTREALSILADAGSILIVIPRAVDGDASRVTTEEAVAAAVDSVEHLLWEVMEMYCNMLCVPGAGWSPLRLAYGLVHTVSNAFWMGVLDRQLPAIDETHFMAALRIANGYVDQAVIELA